MSKLEKYLKSRPKEELRDNNFVVVEDLGKEEIENEENS